MADKWILHRAGILNFWYYDEQIFEFSDGKLLLRGGNGSGKSVTMQSFLPVLLDGKKSPDRLDPFGSKARRMEDYLLGEKEVSNIDERTGYLFLEYKKANTNQYITTGMGMQARRTQPLKSWGFIITDNRRIGEDFELYKWVTSDGKKQKFPRSKTELETVIGDGGEIANSNKEYMMLVNKHIFGFESLEAYEDLIKLLIQLRSPKLSKEFKPTVIYEILEEALPPLTDDDLRHLSESIDQMEQTRQQMEQLDREVSALKKLNDTYTQYNEQVLHEQIATYKQTEQTRKKATAELAGSQKQAQKLESEIEELTTQKTRLTSDEGVLREALDRLKHHEIFKLEEQRQEKELAHEKMQNALGDIKQKIDNKSEKELKTKTQLLALENRQHEQEKLLKEVENELVFLAEESAFAGHEQNILEWQKQKSETVSFELWKTEIKEHINKLNQAFDLLKESELRLELFQEKDRELGESERALDEILLEASKWQTTLDEEKQTLLSLIHAWVEEHPHYEIDSLSLQEIARLIDNLFEKHDYSEIKAKIETYVQLFQNKLHVEIANNQSHYQQVDANLQQLNAKYQQKKSQVDPEPDRHEATLAFRNQLTAKKVEFSPLYKLIEFKDGVSEKIQKRIESAMIDLGLIDALVTEVDVDIEHDRILRANPVFLTQTLADYLQPDKVQKIISAGRIENILQSIQMNEDALVYITPDGAYQAGAFAGHALPYETVRLIGREARERFRLQELRELEKLMLESREALAKIKNETSQLEEQKAQSQVAWHNFPSNNDAQTSYDELSKTLQKEQLQRAQIGQLSTQVRELDEKIQAIKASLTKVTVGINLKPTTNAYLDGLTSAREYATHLENFHRSHQIFHQLLNEATREQEILTELQVEVDELKGELNIQQAELARIVESIHHLEQEMQLKGMAEVQQEIQKNSQMLTETLANLEVVLDQLPRNQTMDTQLKQQISEQAKTVDFWNLMASAWHQTLEKTWRLSGHEGDVFTAQIFSGKFESKKNKSLLERNLNSLYYELQTDLIDHKMANFTENVVLEDWMKTVNNQWQPYIEQWRNQSMRLTVEFDQRGIKLSPTSLYHEILSEWEHQENRLNELDKSLYEEILLHSVGNTLRARIRRAEIWTKKMKKIMEEGDISSGITFSIKWRPITAQTENELDTKDLVDLLKQDATLLSDGDVERITNHFRSKIQTARQQLNETAEGYTLLQALKNALDYRKWFTFVLHYERKNEPKRELTNNQFFKFSGGEKALAMYIPLLTACFSRYQEASSSAPHIISLDEAFAGVDENNIQTMFKIVEQLGFNYIMNSQVLWGDYQTVSALTVSELLRPKNADFVTVINYHWNGEKMTRLEE